MELATISRDQLRVYGSSNWDSPIFTHASSAINGEGMMWSNDGRYLGALNEAGGVSVFDASENYKIVFEAKKQHNAIRHFYFSPLLSYLVTYERFASKDDQDNVFVYNIKTGGICLQIKLKSVTERNWPAFVWTPEERVCVYMTTNTLKVMHGRTLSLQSPLYSLTIPNITQFTISPNGALVAAFFPEAKGQPASLRIFDLTDRSARPRSSKSTFNAQTAKVIWNSSSTALLAIFSTDSDSTSSNYYGTSSLMFLRLNEQGEMTNSSLVTGESGGPCHDAAWSDSNDEFVAVTGKMPAEIALYDGRTGVKRMSFGVTRRNTLRWNAFGRFFIAGGFGNLPGDVDVWDKNRGLCLSTTRIPCTVICEWGPDGRHFLSASTFPRMRVDNFIQVVNYDGTTAAKITDFSELYACKWRPGQVEKFQDTPPSPRVVQSARNPAAANAAADGSPEPVKRAAYRPPGGSGALAEQMRREREIENQKKAVKVKVDAPIPGMTIPTGPSASALRNARRKKAKAAAASSRSDSPDESSDDTQAPQVPVVAEPQQATDPAKRIRNLQKKLKEIVQLKDSGITLSVAQQAKIESEPAVLAEIEELKKLL